MTVKLGWDRERRSNPEFFPTSVSEDKDLLRLTMFTRGCGNPRDQEKISSERIATIIAGAVL